MPVLIEPFDAQHIPAAAEILAASHAQNRLSFSDLPEAFERPETVQPLIVAALAQPGAYGVVALRDGAVLGYFIGEPTPASQDVAVVRAFRPHSARVT